MAPPVPCVQLSVDRGMSGRPTLVDRVTIAISRVTMLLFGVIVLATFYEVVMR